ncbi:MAG: SPFH domain-containing protein [Candidatus Paceibacterota bacterium]|jgi:hypothetical protein
MNVLALVVLALVWIVFSGLKKIPNDPPHIGLLTIFGRRTNKIIREGWCFLFGFPFISNVILVDMRKKNKDFPIKDLRTPDNVPIEVPISLTVVPDGKNLIQYLDNGGENGVFTILEEILEEKGRMWTRAVGEGPADYDEAMSAGEEAVEILIKALAGEKIKKINSPFPTNSLFKYFNTPPKPPTKYEENSFGTNWEKIEEWHEALSQEEKAQLKEELAVRKKIVTEIRQGNGGILLQQLGVKLVRLNIGEIKPTDEFAKDADLAAKEEKQAKGEMVEITNVGNLVKTLKGLIPGISDEEALKTVMAERGKATRTFQDISLSGDQKARPILLINPALPRKGEENG